MRRYDGWLARGAARRWMIAVLLVGLLVPLSATPVSAGTNRYVSTTGTDTSGCPASTPCLHIAYALGQAQSGDTISLGAGIYHEHGMVLSSATPNLTKVITIIGNTQANTVIDGDGADRIFELTYSSTPGDIRVVDLTLKNLTVRNGGNSGTGNGGCIRNNGLLTLDHVTVSGCTTGGEGGGIASASSYTDATVILLASTVSGNTAARHGGGIDSTGGSITLVGTTVSGNHATGTYGQGGGIYSTRSASLMSTLVAGNGASGSGGGVANYGGLVLGGGSAVRGNTTAVDGGGIYNYGGTVTIDRSSVGDTVAGDGNIATRTGGGIANTNGGLLTITTGTINGNRSLLDTESPGGGGIYSDSGVLAVGGNSFIMGNSAKSYGGGIAVVGGTATVGTSTVSGNQLRHDGGGGHNFGGGMYVRSGTLTVTASTIANNQGGGLFAEGTLVVSGSTISKNNSVYNGGGIFGSDSAAITVSDSTIDGNTTGVFGGGIGIGFNGQSTLNVARSTISGNSAGGSGGGVYIFGSATLTDVTISGNHAPAGGGINVFYSHVTVIMGTIAYNDDGIANGGQSVMLLTGTIVANNTGANCSGSIISGGHNMDSGTSCGLTAASDRANADPLLMPLAANAPSTLMTHALKPGSPAIDVGGTSADGCPRTDERGIYRPQPVGGQCDIGAYEYQPVAPGGGGVSPNTGGTGGKSVVTISGSGFQTGSTVSFGGAAAPAIGVNADGTQLTVTTPPHAAGVVDVIVTNPNGQRLNLSGSYTYLSPAALPPARPSGGAIAGSVAPLPPSRPRTSLGMPTDPIPASRP